MLPYLLAGALLLALAPGVPCEGACEVQGSGIVGFVPPVLAMRSGGEVVWRGLDASSHINLEGATNLDPDRSCFVAAFAGSIEDRVRLTLEHGALLATHEGVTKACASAAALPGGGALLTYQCVVHPLTMKAAIAVLP